MFEDSLVESSGTLSKRNPWTAAVSFTMQGVLVGVLVFLPIIYTEALPERQLTSILTEPAPPPGPPPVSAHERSAQPHPTANAPMQEPISIPLHITIVHDQPANTDADAAPDWVGVQGGTGTGAPNSLISTVIQTPPAMPRVVVPPKVRVSSGVAQGLLIHQTKPDYPNSGHAGADSGNGVVASGGRQGWHGAGSACSQRTSSAGESCARRGETLAL